jgi:hypothetical protein
MKISQNKITLGCEIFLFAVTAVTFILRMTALQKPTPNFKCMISFLNVIRNVLAESKTREMDARSVVIAQHVNIFRY